MRTYFSNRRGSEYLGVATEQGNWWDYSIVKRIVFLEFCNSYPDLS